ncbi:LCP family protein [Streptomyces sp. CC208A]|uniref:LCP family protein n=1 Tax=Streptomyces sp. CC208A TaxID=3044573 RepID=UPI0024A7EA0E|nr:LCP family protein [Streptomyces sp. CC208A]
MNDQQNPYDPYYPQQPQIIGYDAYGQPVYQQQGQAPQQPAYDPYAGQQQAYGYDPYAQQQPPTPQQPSYDTYAGWQGHAQPAGYDPYETYGGGQQGQAAAEPAAPVAAAPAGVPGQRPAPEPPAAPRAPRRPAADKGADEGKEYRTEQFSFIEEPDEDSEDVIDWLKFTESRSERREEARRRGRNRVIALVAVLVLAAVGGLGYLWSAGLFPGTGDSGEQQKTTATGPQRRDTIVLHLHDTRSGGTSTALLVDNTTTQQSTTVLLPNALAVADTDGATTTLGKSVEDDGSSGTREALDNLLGAKIAGTWRLDTPYLENLVEYLGGIEVDTDTTVPDPKGKKGADPLVTKGEQQTLSGRAAVAYATHRGPGEAEAKQLQRFGQVVGGVLRKMPSDAANATTAIEYLQQIADPSLPEKDLGASLAKLADHAKTGAYKTALLPVGQDGTLAEGAGDSVVKDILGGKVTVLDSSGVPRVSIKDGTGEDAVEAARVVLVNGGYAFAGGSRTDSRASSEVVYGDDAQKATAVEVAKTLGLPAGAVTKGKPSGSAAVTVVLGRDYEIPGAP